ncbi:hypothetical protein ACJROX_17295 [Pseudalkalibacillus sp. A8]
MKKLVVTKKITWVENMWRLPTSGALVVIAATNHRNVNKSIAE